MSVSNRSCYLCNGSLSLNYFLCDCSRTIFNNPVVQCRSCGQDTTHNLCMSQECKNARQKIIEARIQNQVAVSQSQMNSVQSAFTIRGPNSNFSFNLGDRPSSRIWGNQFNLRNQSDRKNPHYTKNYNVPTGGNSTKSSITANKPGSMSPGGAGVDVKHGSYARYLGKIKANNISQSKMGPFNTPTQDVNGSVSRLEKLNRGVGARRREVMDNKLFRFSIINTRNCC